MSDGMFDVLQQQLPCDQPLALGNTELGRRLVAGRWVIAAAPGIFSGGWGRSPSSPLAPDGLVQPSRTPTARGNVTSLPHTLAVWWERCCCSDPCVFGNMYVLYVPGSPGWWQPMIFIFHLFFYE